MKVQSFKGFLSPSSYPLNSYLDFAMVVVIFTGKIGAVIHGFITWLKPE